jgi:hypothetical protein
MAQSIKKKRQTMLGMVIQSYNPRPLKTGLGGSQIPGQPGLSNSKALSQKKKKKGKEKQICLCPLTVYWRRKL